MKFTKLMLAFGTLALAVASAGSSYKVTLYSPMQVGDTQLKPGDYKVQVEGDKAVFTSGKTVVEVPATLEKGDQKYSSTALEAVDSKLKEIRIGGTNSKIVLMPPAGEHAENK